MKIHTLFAGSVNSSTQTGMLSSVYITSRHGQYLPSIRENIIFFNFANLHERSKKVSVKSLCSQINESNYACHYDISVEFAL